MLWVEYLSSDLEDVFQFYFVLFFNKISFIKCCLKYKPKEHKE